MQSKQHAFINLNFSGARVILACRDMGRATKAADEVRKWSGNGNVVVKMLDLASLQSVRALAKDVQQTEERLDILINNAGKVQGYFIRHIHNYTGYNQ